MGTSGAVDDGAVDGQVNLQGQCPMGREKYAEEELIGDKERDAQPQAGAVNALS